MEKHRFEIFTPRYDGERFNQHRLPLDLVEDLTVFQEMTIEMAKVIYKERNKDRERIPKDFTKGISFELENIGEGSTIPVVVLIASLNGLFPSENVGYFEEAKNRIIQVVQAAEDHTNINKYAPDTVLNYFSRFGKKLGKNEYIEFSPKTEKKAKFTRESRKRIIKASSKANEYTDEVGLRGFISEMDFNKKSFMLDLINGQRLSASYNLDLEEILKNALISFTSPNKRKILLNGTVRFNKNDNILKIESIENISELEDLDVPFRLEQISLLKDGWFDGYGENFSLDQLKWLTFEFENNYNSELPLPNIFPTPKGDIQFEWSLDNIESALNIDLNEKVGSLSIVHISSDEQLEFEINLASVEGWEKLNEIIKNNFIV